MLGPSQDGGYYLIGLKRPHRYLFERIPWSTSDVLSHTIERATDMDLCVELLPLWYDVDDAATLHLLYDELSLLSDGHNSRVQFHSGFHAPHTSAYLAELMAKEGHERFIPSTTISKTRA